MSSVSDAIMNCYESPEFLRFVKRSLTDGMKAFLNRNIHNIRDEEKHSAQLQVAEGASLISLNPSL